MNLRSRFPFGVCCLGGLFLLLGSVCPAWAGAVVERLDFSTSSDTLRIEMSGPASYKVMKLDLREVMVAVKDAGVGGKFATAVPEGHVVKSVKTTKLPDQVVSLMIETTRDVQAVTTQWDRGANILTVIFSPAASPSSKPASPQPIPAKRIKYPKGKIPPLTDETPGPPPEEGPAVPPKKGTPVHAGSPPPAAGGRAEAVPSPTPGPEGGAGATSPPETLRGREARREGDTAREAFLGEMEKSPCGGSPLTADMLALGRAGQWAEAFGLLQKRVDPKSSDPCQREAYYLRALASLQMTRGGDSKALLASANFFQEAMSYFPEAPYTPYALFLLGEISRELSNFTEAGGYYRMVLKNHPNHPMAAESSLTLALLAVKAKKYAEAVPALRDYLGRDPKGPRAAEVTLALGKALYETNQFADSMALLSSAAAQDPWAVYDDPELLITLGNLYYQLGQMAQARETMLRAMNLFPDNAAGPVLFARIGDTLKEDNAPDQARKIYALVMEKYPGSDGAAVSAMRLAELLPSGSAKAAQYRAVIQTYPNNPMAKLASVRLADLLLQAGDYNGSIDALRPILSGDLKELKQEAFYILTSDFNGLFKQLVGEGALLPILSAYEKDKRLIASIGDENLLQMIGEAFFKGNFHPQALELFEKAYKMTSPQNRSPLLYSRLAASYQALGKKEQAKEMYYAYFQAIPKTEKSPDVYLRMGRLLMDEKAWASALPMLETGYAQSVSDGQKAEFLYARAQVYQALGEDNKVPDLLIKAINLMASSPGVGNDRLMGAYRLLGEGYLKLSAHDKAIDAFTMALKFSGGPPPPALLFKLAELKLKVGKRDEAKAAFSEIVAGGDAFWGKLAQEKLRIMELEERLKGVGAPGKRSG